MIGRDWYRNLAKGATVVALTMLVIVTSGIPTPAKADTQFPVGSPFYPCSFLSVGTGVINECHYYEFVNQMNAAIKDQLQKTWQFAVATSILNGLSYFTQRIMTDMADWVLTGFNGEPTFYSKGWGGFFKDVVTNSFNVMISSFNDQYLKSELGIDICQPITLDLKLSLGLSRIPLQQPDCTFETIATNFKTTYQAFNEQALRDTLLRANSPGQNGASLALSSNQKFLDEFLNTKEAYTFDRQEGKGFKLLQDAAGNITTPALAAQQALQASNPIQLAKENAQNLASTEALMAFNAGLSQLPEFAGAVFLNTLAVGLVQKFFNWIGSGNDNTNLLNVDLQRSAQDKSAKQKAAIISDFITPNLVSSDKQNFLFELSSCPTPRGTWGCSMDSGLASALQSATENGAYTVARAAGLGNTQGVSGQQYLHSDWELIPESEAKDNQDPSCYQRAYCSSNLAKLRFARIIPIGWELAANSPFNKKANGRYVTLGEVIRGFNVCNAKDEADAGHPWCHLIDPSWVLTAPPFQCQTRGYSDTVDAAGSRQQECQDVVSCLKRDDKGNCVGGYGYCLSEKTVWRFSADVCEEKYASCRTYTTRQGSASNGQQVSYVRNTLDYGQCNQDNVGCMFYATTEDPSVTSTVAWVSTTSTGDPSSIKLNLPKAYPSLNLAKGAAMPRVYFDATAQPCDASGDGCTKVYHVEPGQPALNLVQNSSFENPSDADPNALDIWTPNGTYTYVANPEGEGDAEDGNQAAVLDTANSLTESVAVAPLRNYVVSFYAKIGDFNAGGSSAVNVQLLDASGKVVATPPVGQGYFRSSNCSSQSQTSPGVTNNNLTDTWVRATCEFVTNKDAAQANVIVQGANAKIDAVQLEEGNAATAYVDGVNRGLRADHLKIAPEELACTGDANKDNPHCGDFARVCSQGDVGCQGYTDTSGGDPTEVPAILSANDYCPNSCVGYAQYQKLPSAFDLTHSPDTFLDDAQDDTNATFIPKQAQQCTAAQAGCEEFTNLETSSAGGEAKAYYTYARACEKPNDNSRTYFTWEGSDTTGYQLRTWSLIKEDPTNPQDDLGSPTETAGGPKILHKAGPDGILKKPELCTDTFWQSGADTDCRQFYDEAGKIFYRFFSQTVVSSDACVDYRKSNSTPADCAKTGGTSGGAGTKDCLYKILPSASNTCQADNAGCRGYIGTTGRNTYTVLHESFAGATSTTPYFGDGSTNVSYSTESLLVGDYSLKLETTANQKYVGIKLPFEATTDTLYTVSFWAKTTDASHDPNSKIVVGKTTVGSFTLGTDWARYEIGPFRTSAPGQVFLEFNSLTNVTYLDEIRVSRLQDAIYVKKDSWTTPAECDQTAQGVPQPQAMLGCREYTDRLGNTVDVRQFSRLCKEQAIGCSAFVDTRNSDDASAQSFTMKGLSAPSGPNAKNWDSYYAGDNTVTRPADRYAYLIDEPSAHCDASQESCRAFGKPTFSADGQPSGYKTVYLKDDITKYVDGNGNPDMLCRPSALFCDAFQSGQTAAYFRDPAAMGNHACEWRERVLLPDTVTKYGTTFPAGEYSGFFVQGVDPPEPCYPDLLSSGNNFLMSFSAAPNYRGWTELCPQDQSECTEYRDPNDHTDPAHPGGKSYFFIANNKLDLSTCNGIADPLNGCVLFRDMGNSQLLYSSKATYAKLKQENDNPVAAVNCVTDPSNAACKNAGTCQDLVQLGCGGNGCNPNAADSAPNFISQKSGASCTTDTDCSHTSAYADPDGYDVKGTCMVNDANTVVKVKLDRDCQTWLGCATAETVYDPSQQKYVDICTDLKVCDQPGGSTSKNFCAHYVDRSPTAPVPKQGEGFYEPVLRQGVFLDLPTYMDRPTGFSDPDYSGYALPNHYQIADYSTRRVGYELLAGLNDNTKDTYIHDYRLTAALPIVSQINGTTVSDYNAAVNACANALQSGGASQLKSTCKGAAALYVDPKYPYLNLCRSVATGQVGYYLVSAEEQSKAVPPARIPAEPKNCYLAIDAPYVQSAAELFGQSNTNPRNAENAAVMFQQLKDPAIFQPLSDAFPPAECKAYPESSSPFPTWYVKNWDLTKDPPQPSKVADGYDSATFCQYGENCSCSYRKISYGGKTLYYQLYGQTPPSGICVGGQKDGVSCDTGAGNAGGEVPKTDGSTQGSAVATSTGTFNQCGSGVCSPIDTIALVRGQYGQCLQRDPSRVIGGSQEHNPCLVWDPTPVLFGQSDIYHYQPTAGYLPPANSGEYYCVANALPPKTTAIPASESWLGAPGQMKGKGQFNFDEDYVSDGSCFACAGNDGTFIDGNSADGGSMGSQCEQADDQENGGNPSAWSTVESYTFAGGITSGFGLINSSHMASQAYGRWIQTGRGSGRSYDEYFIGFNGPQWAKFLYQLDKAPDYCLTHPDSSACDAMLERNFSNFTFKPMSNPGNGIIGCGFSGNWAGVSVDSYDNTDDLNKGTNDWLKHFNQNFSQTMGPDSAQNFMNSDGTALQKVPCKYDGDKPPNDENCFYRYWEIGYQNSGQKEFRMQWPEYGGPVKFDEPYVYYQKSDSSKPFFSIRAMFEDTNKDENGIATEEMNPQQLAGPFRFVGFWVTASMPGGQSESAIYMGLVVGHSDICHQVAQVVAPDTRDATPFMDRIQQDANYTVPVLGDTYSTKNAPFGSARNSAPIGISPLYQVPGAMPGSDNKLRPPIWLSAGAEYANKGSVVPTGNWAWLTNIFARVYRVYRWYDRPVGKTSYACIDGPRFGAWCPTPASGATATDMTNASITYCGYAGTCNSKLIDASKGQALCNSLSGVNSGLPCSGDLGNQLEGYGVCHNAPMKLVQGQLQPQYTSCDLQSGWEQNNLTYTFKNVQDATMIKNANANTACNCQASGHSTCQAGDTIICQTAQAASDLGAMRCANNAVHYPVKYKNGKPDPNGDPVSVSCTKVASISQECPIEVLSGPDTNDGEQHAQCVNNHCTNGYEHAACTQSSDCEFTWIEWWNNGKDYPNPYPAGQGNFTIEGHKDYFWANAPYFETYGGGDDSTVNKPYTNVTLGDVGTNDWWIPSAGAGNRNDSSDGVKNGNDIGGKDLRKGRYLVFPSKAAELHKFPGVFVETPLPGDDYQIFIPGHCERPPVDKVPHTAPYDSSRYRGPGWTPGICEGGAYEGSNCTQNADCAPPDLSQTDVTKSGYFCQPVSTSGPNNALIPNSSASADYQGAVPSQYRISFDCDQASGDSHSQNLDTDNNLCTHNAGYYARADLCGDMPDRQECLTAIRQNDLSTIGSKTSNNLSLQSPPTDVTPGHYTPDYLAQINNNPNLFAALDQRYVSYYTPRPPTMAAPDTGHACQAAGQCGVARTNAFTFENQTEGKVAYVGGQAIATLRFYGWAADNQGPLTDAIVDWGDGQTTETHDAKMKNKKPFCGVSKECEFTPGLTCSSDADCPPGGGKCINTGFCNARPNVTCQTDSDCTVGIVTDKCVIRTTFGNTDSACEQNYFDYSHAYTCSKQQEASLPACGNEKRCSRDTDRKCTSDANCAVGDTCLSDLAPPGGCYDAQNAACRFTPRVQLKDAWGWCTGECRIQDLGGNQPGAGFSGGGYTNTILYQNGGCYDATRLYNVDNSKVPFSLGTGQGKSVTNTCDTTLPNLTPWRPWVVYPGALQLGVQS